MALLGQYSPRGEKSRGFVFLFAFALILAGCATVSSSVDRSLEADKIADKSGLTKSLVKADPFVLTSYQKLKSPGKPLTVYIEGDGLAWISQSALSDNPTPLDPLMLELASLDPSENVVYLARPCQYTPAELNAACKDPSYWTDKRFSDQVISAMNEALDYFVEESQAKKVNLIGFSGGAAVAVLLAARRTDIASLRTVAGNLDPQALNRYHHVEPLEGSLDPIQVADKLSDLPQVHFVGEKDTVVPSFVAEGFVKRLKKSNCAKVIKIESATHHDGWREKWKELLKEPL